jgi:hypothetical protein
MCCAGLAWFFADERMTNTAFPSLPTEVLRRWECMPLGCKAWAAGFVGLVVRTWVIYFSSVIYQASGDCRKNLPHKSFHFLSGKQS